MAENGWNSRDPEKVSLVYTPDSFWRNRAEFVHGRQEIIAFLRRKWAKELDYRLIKEVWAYTDNRIAVRFAYEWHDDAGNWFRSYGNENWEFARTARCSDVLPASTTCRSRRQTGSITGRWDPARKITPDSPTWACNSPDIPVISACIQGRTIPEQGRSPDQL